MVFCVQTEKRIGLAILVAKAFKPKASRVRIFLKLAASMRLYIKTTASQTEEEEGQTEEYGYPSTADGNGKFYRLTFRCKRCIILVHRK